MPTTADAAAAADPRVIAARKRLRRLCGDSPAVIGWLVADTMANLIANSLRREGRDPGEIAHLVETSTVQNITISAWNAECRHTGKDSSAKRAARIKDHIQTHGQRRWLLGSNPATADRSELAQLL